MCEKSSGLSDATERDSSGHAARNGQRDAVLSSRLHLSAFTLRLHDGAATCLPYRSFTRACRMHARLALRSPWRVVPLPRFSFSAGNLRKRERERERLKARGIGWVISFYRICSREIVSSFIIMMISRSIFIPDPPSLSLSLSLSLSRSLSLSLSVCLSY